MSEFLLSLAIESVDDFVCAARRCRDLACGSYLLSEVSKACALRLHLIHRAVLIYPNTPDPANELQPGPPFIAVNRILACVSAPDEGALRKIVADCKSFTQNYLATVELDPALANAARTLASDGIEINSGTARNHVLSLVEFYAAWAALDPGRSNYASARALAEKRLDSRLSLNNFNPHAGESDILKSSLDGFRESVLQRTGTKTENQYFVRSDEELDGVAILKRFGGGGRRKFVFDSTLDVAAVAYKERIKRTHPTVVAGYHRFLDVHSKVLPNTDAFLYPLESRRIKDPELRAELDHIIKPLESARPEAPYYALLNGDGDGMGSCIANTLKTMEEHQRFSLALSAFARDVLRMFQNMTSPGECIYAGGDDVMALLPLHLALSYARKIREVFAKHMHPWPVTFSAGIAVAHALEPLDDVRRLAAAAETQAKSVPGKDALAIIVTPRSGADISAAGKWDDIIPAVEKIAKLYASRQLSKSLGHELRTLLNRWKGDLQAQADLDDALPSLAIAIAKKKKQELGEQALTLVSAISSRHDLETLVDNLFVARPFARAMREAGESQ